MMKRFFLIGCSFLFLISHVQGAALVRQLPRALPRNPETALRIFRAIKKPTMQDIMAMRRFLNASKNYTCMRTGAGCTAAERAALLVISSLVAKVAYEGEQGRKRKAAEQEFIRLAGLGDLSRMQKLLKTSGFDVNAFDANGVTALMEAVRVGNEKVVSFLLGLPELYVNALDANSWNALQWAAFFGHADKRGMLDQLWSTITGSGAIVEQLLSAGADRNDAAEIARMRGNKKTADLITGDAGAVKNFVIKAGPVEGFDL